MERKGMDRGGKGESDRGNGRDRTRHGMRREGSSVYSRHPQREYPPKNLIFPKNLSFLYLGLELSIVTKS